MLIKSLISSKSLIILGALICIVAAIWGANNVENKDVAHTITNIGLYIFIAGIITNMLFADSSAPMARPLKVFAVGFAVIILGEIYETNTGNSPDVFNIIGYAICLLSLVWAIFWFKDHQ